MFRSVACAYHWIKARKANQIDGPEAALLHIARIEALRPLPYWVAAYKAFLLFHSQRDDEADDLFEEVEAKLSHPRNADEEYVRLFCQFFGSKRVSTLEEADEIWTEAQGLKCSAMFRRALPFYRKPSVTAQDRRVVRLHL